MQIRTKSALQKVKKDSCYDTQQSKTMTNKTKTSPEHHTLLVFTSLITYKAAFSVVEKEW